MIKFPYVRLERPERKFPKDFKRFVVKMDQPSLNQYPKYATNPGTLAVAGTFKPTQIVGPDQVRVAGELCQVQTRSLHADWIAPIQEGVTRLVLVWPFFPPTTWQIVGYYTVTPESKPPIAWNDFTPFEVKYVDKTGAHLAMSQYSEES
jgi:hypothetical protein